MRWGLLCLLTGLPPALPGQLAVWLAAGAACGWLFLLLGATAIGSCCCSVGGLQPSCTDACPTDPLPFLLTGTVTASTCPGMPVGTVLTYGPAVFIDPPSGWVWVMNNSAPPITPDWTSFMACSAVYCIGGIPTPCLIDACEGGVGGLSQIVLADCDPFDGTVVITGFAGECLDNGFTNCNATIRLLE